MLYQSFRPNPTSRSRFIKKSTSPPARSNSMKPYWTVNSSPNSLADRPRSIVKSAARSPSLKATSSAETWNWFRIKGSFKPGAWSRGPKARTPSRDSSWSRKDRERALFDHIGFPEGLHDHLAAGWEENYWSLLKKYFH